MSFDVIATDPFERKLKKLAKKHKSLKADLSIIIDQLTISPDLGTPLGKDCYKIRVAITSKSKGKSSGARLITYIRVVKETVYLMDIYDKSDQSTISDKELRLLVDLLAED
ncbi:MAG: type II toxin-antitoxin system RelE/ParE family toxin [Cyclobacteriaceae bacterium]|nr:type II toxin-antitoxin system RelE/ParE family toxin [Cyclobacteriaceae bacterium]